MRQKIVAAFLFSGIAMGVRAQTSTGSIFGRVLDSQQRAFPGSEVTLTNVATEFERHTTTTAEGEYEISLVPPGKFTLRAASTGFAPRTILVEVVAATATRADLTLRVESVQQVVSVVGDSGVSVQTETADLGQTFGQHEVSQLPSLTRSPYDLIAIVPGANPSHDQRGVGFAVNGQRTTSGNYLLDGGENNDTFISAPGQDVPLDSIQEFTLQSNHFSAEYGRNSAFIANVVTKSGTKDLHGSLYDYWRNSRLAANTFFNNSAGIPRSVFNRHQFGGTLGGPISARKLFFFVSVEPILVRSSVVNTFFAPTPQLLAVSAPGTQGILENYPLPPPLSTGDVLVRTVCPFGSSCDPQTKAGFVTLPAFALTSRTGPQDAGAGSPQNTVLATGRLDWAINSNTQSFVRYACQNKDEFATVLQPYSSKLDQPAFGRNQNIALNLIRTWTPRLASESRIVYNRLFGDPDRFGSSPLVPQPPIPAFSIQNEPSVVLPFGSIPFGGPQNLYQFFQTVTLARGHHTPKFGGQYVHLRDNRTFGIGEVATATFLSTQGFVNGKLAHYSIALDPKGHFPGESVDPPFGPPSFTRHYHYNEPALFIEDTWKTTPRLTLTAGVRWEYFGVFHSPSAEHSLDSNFYLGPGNNYLRQIANGRFLRTIDAPADLRGHFYLPDYKNFAPRMGFAYDLFGDGKSVFRVGAGLFYDRIVGFELFRSFQNPPSYSVTTLKNIPVTAELLSNQYSAFPNIPFNLNLSDTKAPSETLRTSYTASWNATLEHELDGRFVLGASYLGASGDRLYSKNNVNRVGSGGLLDSSCIVTRFAADGTTALGPDYTNCPRLNPDISSIPLRANLGHSSFQALELKLNTGYLSGWDAQFGVNYTWSHSIDNASSSAGDDVVANAFAPWFLDGFHPALDRGPSDFDQRHRIAAHFVWEVPLGRNSTNWEDRYLLAGWEITGLLSYQTGQPFTIVDSGVPDFTGESTRPRLTGKPPPTGPLVPDAAVPDAYLYLRLNPVYDPATGICMANTAPFACEISVNGPFDGTLPRNTYRRPGTYYQDTALLKNIPLPNEAMMLQFRIEFYNVFNHPNLYIDAGTTDINTSSFTARTGQTLSGVTASFKDNRQIVLALKLLF
jgi:Carboxypeptidase regulatory-like domain